MNLATLKKSLSECHMTTGDRKLKLLKDVKDPEYYLHRIMECVELCRDGDDVPENTKLGIQLFNIYRVVCNERVQSERESTDRTRSENPDGNNNSPPVS